jgi:HAD superfamily hydrolase (TIGR01509 family)
MLAALVWDVDGTLAETERDGHRVAFNRAFESLGLAWRWDEAHYGALLHITGGRERLLHDMAMRGDAPGLAEERARLAGELHRHKNAHYAEIVQAGDIALREGVVELIDEAAAAGLRQGIATTTSRSNVQALLQRQLGAGWRERFGAVVCGEDVSTKKPDPQVYRLALQALGLPPMQALALEDSPSGVQAARLADVPVVVTRSAYFAHDTVEGALAIGPGLHSRKGWRPGLIDDLPDGPVTLNHLRDWHARMERVSQHTG